MNLFLFESLTGDPVVKALLTFRETGEEEAYYDVARSLVEFAKSRKTTGNIIKEYVIQRVLDSENLPYIGKLRDYLRQDIKTVFCEFLDVDWDRIFREKGLLPLTGILLNEEPKEDCAEYIRSMEMMMDCTSNEALVGALLAHVESFCEVDAGR